MSASWCGCVGMKPTHGVVNSEGAKRYSHTLDTIGWYGRAPEDLRLVAEAFRLFGLDVPLGKSLKQLRIGLCRGPNWEIAAPEAPRAAELECRELAVRREAIDRALACLQVGGNLVNRQDFVRLVAHLVIRG